MAAAGEAAAGRRSRQVMAQRLRTAQTPPEWPDRLRSSWTGASRAPLPETRPARVQESPTLSLAPRTRPSHRPGPGAAAAGAHAWAEWATAAVPPVASSSECDASYGQASARRLADVSEAGGATSAASARAVARAEAAARTLVIPEMQTEEYQISDNFNMI